jgi:hypothetical protein
MKNAIKAAIVLASLSVFACDKPQEDAKPAVPAPTATATTATNTNTNTTAAAQPNAAPVTIADTDLATPADYEAEAEKTITSKNYKTEMASLEAEMNK